MGTTVERSMEALPPQDLGTVHETTTDQTKSRDEELSPMSVRQVAELAASAAQRSSTIDQQQSPAQAAQTQADEREKLMRAPPARRGVSRHKSSSGGGHPGSLRKKPQLLRAQSMRVSGALPPKSGEPSRSLSRANSACTDQSPMLVSRSLSRAKSSMADGPLTRSLKRENSARGLPPSRHIGRTNSQRSLAHMGHAGSVGVGKGQPQRTISTDSASGLRPYRGREQVVNQSIQRMDSSTGAGGDNRSVSEMSAFTMGTMDSVSLRKAQIVADPIDDHTYNETMSFADHDSVSMMSDFPDYTEFLPGQLSASSHNPRRVLRREDSMSGTFCTLDSVQLRQKQVSEADFCDASFSTIESRDLCFEAQKDFDEYSCLDEYSSREYDKVEVVNEVDEYDDDSDDDANHLDLGNVVIDDDSDDEELLEEDEGDNDADDGEEQKQDGDKEE